MLQICMNLKSMLWYMYRVNPLPGDKVSALLKLKALIKFCRRENECVSNNKFVFYGVGNFVGKGDNAGD